LNDRALGVAEVLLASDLHAEGGISEEDGDNAPI